MVIYHTSVYCALLHRGISTLLTSNWQQESHVVDIHVHHARAWILDKRSSLELDGKWALFVVLRA